MSDEHSAHHSARSGQAQEGEPNGLNGGPNILRGRMSNEPDNAITVRMRLGDGEEVILGWVINTGEPASAILAQLMREIADHFALQHAQAREQDTVIDAFRTWAIAWTPWTNRGP